MVSDSTVIESGEPKMEIERSIAIMKALADKSRLAIINSLLEQSQYVEEIAKRHALAASTVSFHLSKLEQAGLVTSHKEQYYAVFQAVDAIFDTTLREIVSAPPAGKDLQDERMNDYRRKVLEVFFRQGILEKLPTQHKKRSIVLEQFAARFLPERRYAEQEVTELITPLFGDYCTIRRLLVDEGLIRREGALYWREEAPGAQTVQQIVTQENSGGSRTMKKDDRRSELKRVYRQNSPEMGVYQIKNRINGKIYLDSCKNLEGTRNSRLFQLKMGKVVFSSELQRELDEFGAGSFEFSVLEVLEKPELEGDSQRLLAALELRWLDELQPFAERGYNSIKAYQRAKGQLKSQ
jgi:DNA-binding transcriptional regulator YhcF (GntR family)